MVILLMIKSKDAQCERNQISQRVIWFSLCLQKKNPHCRFRHDSIRFFCFVTKYAYNIALTLLEMAPLWPRSRHCEQNFPGRYRNWKHVTVDRIRQMLLHRVLLKMSKTRFRQWLIVYSTPTHSLTHWGRDKLAAIFQTPFSNGNSWMKMCKFRKCHWSLFLGVKLT